MAVVMLLFAIGLSASILQPATADSCAALIPDAVRQAAAKRFARYELPHESDNTAEDIRQFRARTGSACLGAAVARFTGKATNDYALLLTDRKSGHAMLVVATRGKNGWQFDRLRDWGVGLRDEVFVQVAPHGHYVRHPDAKSEPFEFTSSLPGVLTGAIAQSSAVYFFAGTRWIALPFTN